MITCSIDIPLFVYKNSTNYYLGFVEEKKPIPLEKNPKEKEPFFWEDFYECMDFSERYVKSNFIVWYIMEGEDVKREFGVDKFIKFYGYVASSIKEADLFISFMCKEYDLVFDDAPDYDKLKQSE